MKPSAESRTPLLAAVLSLSLLTVMAGAAVAPALDLVRRRFAEAPDLLVQWIVSLPALFIILTNFAFPLLGRFVRTRTLALAGLGLYVAAGAAPYFCENLGAVLACRALLGVAVGVLMPLSTGLLAYHFPPERIPGLMGLSAAMNQFGGVVATFLAGLLAAHGWHRAFLVYLLALGAVPLVAAFLPDEPLARPAAAATGLRPRLRRHGREIAGMLLCMALFFVYPSAFAMVAGERDGLDTRTITLFMVGMDAVAFLAGLSFGRVARRLRAGARFVAPACFFAGYLALAFWRGPAGLAVGSAAVGVAAGIGVPLLNTIAAAKAGRDAATTAMPLLSAALYLGQFLSPILLSDLGRRFLAFGDVPGPYLAAVAVSLLFFFQSLGETDIFIKKREMAQS